MRLSNILALLSLLALLTAPPLCAQVTFGASGEEGEPFRRQEWRVPSPDSDIAAHALLFRPFGAGPFRLAVIAHASTQNVLRRAQMPQPEYRALAAFLVARGFAVLVPERLGHGATGGRYVEDQGGCDEADYARSGRATAGEISLALDHLRKQDFIRQDGAIVVGHSGQVRKPGDFVTHDATGQPSRDNSDNNDDQQTLVGQIHWPMLRLGELIEARRAHSFRQSA